MRHNGQPNPTGTGPYCAPNRCYCGSCPVWRPIPPVDWPRVVRALREDAARKHERKQERFVPTRSDW